MKKFELDTSLARIRAVKADLIKSYRLMQMCPIRVKK